jgi:MoxR-like ATPase
LSEKTNPIKQLYNNLSSVIYCRQESLILTITTLLCRGHLLIEDAPGLGKTTLAQALSKSLELEIKRVQCTPDLMPSDITGINVYNSEEHKFHFIPGPVFTNVLLMDEINRATPRTQSALLEAMAEGTVTMDRETHQLPTTFFVMATQNPVEFNGTYPLPEAQLDRFFMRISLGYPNEQQEKKILQSQQSGHPLNDLQVAMTEETLVSLQQRCEKMPVSDAILTYITQLVQITRDHTHVKLGASPRGSLALMKAARAMAVITGKKSVTPDIVQKLLEPVLAHRLIFKDSMLMREENRQTFWQEILEKVAVPDFPRKADIDA